MKKQFTSLLVLSFLFSGCASLDIKNSERNDYTQALSINRPAKDIERDINRKPKEVLKFANITNAVSYTHLDVYKRQEHGIRPVRYHGR